MSLCPRLSLCHLIHVCHCVTLPTPVTVSLCPRLSLCHFAHVRHCVTLPMPVTVSLCPYLSPPHSVANALGNNYFPTSARLQLSRYGTTPRTEWRTNQGLIPSRTEIVLPFSKAPRPASGGRAPYPTESKGSPNGVNRTGRGTNHSTPHSAEVNNA